MKTPGERCIAPIIASLCIALATLACAGGGTEGSSGPQDQTLPRSYAGRKIIFVTSESHNGDLMSWRAACSGRSTGLEAADCVCQQYAETWGNLSGTYKAWLSDSRQSAASRLTHSTVPYVNRSGRQIAANWTELTTAACSDVWQTEAGSDVWNGNMVWTGSDSDGNVVISSYTQKPLTCNDWAGGTIRYGGYAGPANLEGLGSYPNSPGCWSEFGWQYCDEPAHLYCVEQ